MFIRPPRNLGADLYSIAVKVAAVFNPQLERDLTMSGGAKERTISFVADGFVVPEAKSNVAWLDEDSLLVGTDWGDGSLTNSGYALEIRGRSIRPCRRAKAQ